MLTDALIANIAARYGRCGHDWYITEDTGGALYLYVKSDKGCTYPILLHPAIMRHLGLLPDEAEPETQQDQQEELPSRDAMLLQIMGYYNTHSSSERRMLLAQCHAPNASVNNLIDEDVVRLYNILKTKGYTWKN